jgi:hypothetical protein
LGIFFRLIGQMKTLLGPSMKVSAWLDDLPQKLHIALFLVVLDFLAIIVFLNPVSDSGFSPSTLYFGKAAKAS